MLQRHRPRQLLIAALSYLIVHLFLFINTASSISTITKLRVKMGQKISTSLTTSQWYLYGRRQFTQTGYRRHIEGYTAPVQESAAIPLGAPGSDGVNLGGKVVIISGANSGLGKEMATYAAAKGANLYMLCRSKERADRARTEILEATGA